MLNKHDTKAVALLEAELVAGATVTVHAAYGYYTVGAYTPAVGAGGYAVYGYGGFFGIGDVVPAREYTGPNAAHLAAMAAVRSCGSTRANEAARKSARARARCLPSARG